MVFNQSVKSEFIILFFVLLTINCAYSKETESCVLKSNQQSNKIQRQKIDKTNTKKLMNDWIAKIKDMTLDLYVNPFDDFEHQLEKHWIHSCIGEKLGKKCLFFLKKFVNG